MNNNGCECSDSGCKAHNGESICESSGTTILYRIDMQDETGTLFCESCSDDAMESGLFTDDINNISTRELWEECPVCSGICHPMGTLGRVTWYRCENCGMDFKE